MPRCAVLLLAFVLCYVQSPLAGSAEGDSLLADLKVAFIYNFTRFIQWPEAPADQPFVIGVVGDPVMESRLRVLEQEARQVNGRPIAIHAYAYPGAPDCCEILFVGGAADAELEAIVRRTAGQPVLLVGDTPGYAGRGVAIELFRKPDVFRKTERLRLRIDPAALRERGLVISAQLYDVAEVMQ
jgi:hypothetical protein